MKKLPFFTPTPSQIRRIDSGGGGEILKLFFGNPMRRTKVWGFIISFLPLAAFAAEGETIQTLLQKISTMIINPIINLLLVVATLVFLWGVIQYSLATDSPDKAKKARSQIVWGIVGLTVMASAWAIVRMIQASLNF